MTNGRSADSQPPRRSARTQSIPSAPGMTSGRVGQPRTRVSDEQVDHRVRPAPARPGMSNRPSPSPGRMSRDQRPSPGGRRAQDRPGGQDVDLIDALWFPAGPDTGTGRAEPGRGPSGRVSGGGAGPTRTARPVRPARQRPPMSHRGRRTRRNTGARVNTRGRTRGALIIVLTLLAIALGKLVTIQTVDASALTTAGLDQTEFRQTLYAQRGSITDRNGNPLAFSVEGRAIAARPADFENDTQRERVADVLVAALGNAVSRPDLIAKMKSTHGYVYLARDVMPGPAAAIMAKIGKLLVDRTAPDAVRQKLANAVGVERQDIRTTPDGALAASVVGDTGWNGHGQAGIESKFDGVLNGTDGTRTLQVDSGGTAIPNTVSKLVPAVDGTSLRLTLDQDMQYTVAQYLHAQVAASQARGGCAIVKGISDGQIYAMACDRPGQTAAQIGNPAVSAQFEPGSVNKVVTFAAALDRGLITPTTVLSVDGQIAMGGRLIHDAWVHSAQHMTATGVLSKSSNVGTLMIAQKVGPTAFIQELAKFGLGEKTGIELPGEEAGSYPAQSQWSATTFANLPIGQGVSMTLLQMVDMYQAIGNQGVLVSPTIIAGTSRDGAYSPTAPRATNRVMKATTAATLLGMLRGTVQSGDQYHRGTAPKAAITGYQVAGKTGTAQQVDPVTHAYSDTLTNATFAGIVPADKPRYAIAIMIDAPVNGSEGGDSAAPLFHQIASYALRAADVPPSATAAPIYDLYVK